MDTLNLQQYLTEHFRPKLVHWNESVYCTPIDRALTMRFNKGLGSVLPPTISELLRFLWNQLRRFLEKINAQILEDFQQFFFTKQGFSASKKYKKSTVLSKMAIPHIFN